MSQAWELLSSWWPREPCHFIVTSLFCPCNLLAPRPATSSRPSHTHVFWFHFAVLQFGWPMSPAGMCVWTLAPQLVRKVLDLFLFLGCRGRVCSQPLAPATLFSSLAAKSSSLWWNDPLELWATMSPFPSVCVCWGIYLSFRKENYHTWYTRFHQCFYFQPIYFFLCWQFICNVLFLFFI